MRQLCLRRLTAWPLLLSFCKPLVCRRWVQLYAVSQHVCMLFTRLCVTPQKRLNMCVFVHFSLHCTSDADSSQVSAQVCSCCALNMWVHTLLTADVCRQRHSQLGSNSDCQVKFYRYACQNYQRREMSPISQPTCPSLSSAVGKRCSCGKKHTWACRVLAMLLSRARVRARAAPLGPHDSSAVAAENSTAQVTLKALHQVDLFAGCQKCNVRDT